MKDRIRQIMEAQHMSQQVFAEFIGTTPATLSGIFNDRTRPTLNIVESIKKKIPDINTDWLMFGVGSMFRDGEDASSTHMAAAEQPRQGDIFLPENFSDYPSTPLQGHPSSVQTTLNNNSVKSTRAEVLRENMNFLDKPQRKVTEIRVYYDDQTWESFVPSKK